MIDTPVLFDTHASVKRLITAGMSEAIAEALVEEQQKWHNSNLANLATKQDIALLKKDTESLCQEMTHQFARVDDRIESLRQETKQEFALIQKDIARIETRVDSLADHSRILMWMIGLMFAFNGLLIALVKFL